MSLYRHVSGKDELLVSMMDSVLGEDPLPTRPPKGWRAQLQSHDTATQYAADQLAWRADRDGHGQPLPEIPDWIDALQLLDPRIVYFAHDRSVWTP